jgi:AcrR family transcriptional regulator
MGADVKMSKKQLIMDTALELFAKQGFEATSVQEITSHCGISKGAFYLVFKSKDELILALIDHFMRQITSDIDHIVRNTKEEELLYQFFYTIYKYFYKHSDFAKVLFKEQSQTFNKALILKMQYYDKLLTNSILSMIDRLFGEAVKEIKYDLMYCVKGLINTYAQLFVFFVIPLDLNVLAQSLVEKTSLLAKHMTVPFISEDLVDLIRLCQPLNEEVTKEQIITVVDSKIAEMEESLEKESLVLLKEELLEPKFPPAVVVGLLENIRKHPHCKWVAYLLRRYFD